MYWNNLLKLSKVYELNCMYKMYIEICIGLGFEIVEINVYKHWNGLKFRNEIVCINRKDVLKL